MTTTEPPLTIKQRHRALRAIHDSALVCPDNELPGIMAELREAIALHLPQMSMLYDPSAQVAIDHWRQVAEQLQAGEPEERRSVRAAMLRALEHAWEREDG